MGAWHAANGHQHLVGGKFALAPGVVEHAYGVTGRVHALHLAAQVHLQTELAQRGRHRFDQFLVVQRQQAVLRLHHRHVGAELAVHRAQLQANVATAHHHQFFRNRGG